MCAWKMFELEVAALETEYIEGTFCWAFQKEFVVRRY